MSISCYNCEIDQLNKILHQDVYKTEARVVTGCCSQDVVVHKFQNLQIEKPRQKNIKKRAINLTITEDFVYPYTFYILL